MKSIVFTTALITATAFTVIGQSNTSDPANTPKQDTTTVKMGKMKITSFGSKEHAPETIIIDREIETDTIKCEPQGKKNHEHVSHWAGVRMGINGYFHKDALAMPASHDFLELDYAKSLSFDLNFFEKDFNLYKQHIELVTGLGLHFSNYAFKSRHQTIMNTEQLSAVTDSTITFEKNKLKATYLTAPLMLGFSTSKNENKAMRFAAGGQVSWLMGSKLKQVYQQSGDTHKPKVKSDYDLNPFLFHAVASVGYGPVNVFATYGLNNLFEDKKTLALTPFDVGLQLMF